MLLGKKIKYRLDNYAKLDYLNYRRNIIKFPTERIQKTVKKINKKDRTVPG